VTTLIAILMLLALLVPMWVGIRRLRDLPRDVEPTLPPDRPPDEP